MDAVVDACHAAGATIVLRSNELTTMFASLKSGAGLALLPCFLADGKRAIVRLTPRILATRGISLAYSREMRLVGAIRVTIQFIIDVMSKHAAKLSGAQGAASA